MAGMTDVETERIQAVLRSLAAEGCAVVAIEHVLPAIAPIASRAQVLDFGRTLAEGTPERVLREPAVVEAYLGTDEDSLPRNPLPTLPSSGEGGEEDGVAE
jgi:ABC-type branched-subunit amino acid transport system ATPase component